MPKSNLKAGNIRGLLTITGETVRDKRNNLLYICKCVCGNEIKTDSSKLNSGHTKSCGCLNKKMLSERRLKHGHNRNKNSITPEYRSYFNMKQRCLNHKNSMYRHYGGRGIEICDRWLNSFENFIADMGLKPQPGLQIERINNDGDYEPENCKWATVEEQCRNKRNNHIIVYQGKQYILNDLCKILNISGSALRKHLKTKSIEETIEYFKNKDNSLIQCFTGERHSVAQWAKILNINRVTLKEHLQKRTIDQMIIYYKNKRQR